MLTFRLIILLIMTLVGLAQQAPAAPADTEQFVIEDALHIRADFPHTDKTLLDDRDSRFPPRKYVPAMMWEVKDGEKSVFILGSLHMAPKSLYPLPATIMRAFSNAQVVVFEIDPPSMDATLQQRFQLAGQIGPGKNLFDELPAETSDKLNAAALRNHLPIQAFNRMKPWMAAVVLATTEMMSGGADNESNMFGLDEYFATESKKLGKPTRGLESGEDQIQLFSEMSDELSLAFLEQTLDELSNIDEFMNEIITYWRSGDDKGMWRVIEKSFAAYPEVYDRWVVARNKAWITKIESYINDDAGALIVVGSAHVVGPDGLPELLHNRGFDVIRHFHE